MLPLDQVLLLLKTSQMRSCRTIEQNLQEKPFTINPLQKEEKNEHFSLDEVGVLDSIRQPNPYRNLQLIISSLKGKEFFLTLPSSDGNLVQVHYLDSCSRGHYFTHHHLLGDAVW